MKSGRFGCMRWSWFYLLEKNVTDTFPPLQPLMHGWPLRKWICHPATSMISHTKGRASSRQAEGSMEPNVKWKLKGYYWPKFRRLASEEVFESLRGLSAVQLKECTGPREMQEGGKKKSVSEKSCAAAPAVSRDDRKVACTGTPCRRGHSGDRNTCSQRGTQRVEPCKNLHSKK